jgi:hypothetical protein
VNPFQLGQRGADERAERLLTLINDRDAVALLRLHHGGLEERERLRDKATRRHLELLGETVELLAFHRLSELR